MSNRHCVRRLKTFAKVRKVHAVFPIVFAERERRFILVKDSRLFAVKIIMFDAVFRVGDADFILCGILNGNFFLADI